jgi:electron transfer flavoprotein beta subunit
MSKYLVCYKWVLDEADIRVNDDLSVDTGRAKYKISEFDRSAIEAAMDTAQSTDSEVHTLTFGNPEAARSLKDALSRGPAEGYWIADTAADTADGRATAQALYGGVRAVGDVAAVFCAEGASDTYARHVPGRLAALLDWPLVSSVLSLEIKGNTLTAVRKLDNSLQTVRVTLPAVISILPENFEPKAPGLKAVMEGGRKPAHQLDASAIDADISTKNLAVRTEGFVMYRKNIILKDLSASEAAAATVASLRKEGLV